MVLAMDTSTSALTAGAARARADFYVRLAKRNTVPLWEVLNRLVLPEPHPACVPAFWKYEDIRPLLMEAGELIDAREAERRVLVLENPGLPGASQISQSLYAGIQLILPGELAPSHRHAASALRFIMEGDGGGYTAVNGERTHMRTGDLVLTPSWTFHDHGNIGASPVIWMDVLDIPIVNMFDTSFLERCPEETREVRRPEGDTTARHGSNMLPVEDKPSDPLSPPFNYPYSRSRDALLRLSRDGPIHPCHGVKMQYNIPAAGGYPMPTIAAFLQQLPKGFLGKAYRSTDSTIYNVVEGRGRSRIGGSAFSWGPKDVFVVPSWQNVVHEAETEAVLFSASDRAAQQALGLWREQAHITE
jgi:gentisate 1,2-dioxygenase